MSKKVGIIAHINHGKTSVAAALLARLCICPPADKGKAFGKITAGCPIHAQPVDGPLDLPVEGGI